MSQARRLRSASDTVTRRDMTTNDALALSVLEVLQDENIKKRLQDILVPEKLTDAIAMLTAKVASLTEDLNTKDNQIDELVKRVNTPRRWLTQWSSTPADLTSASTA